ncbi:MAG: anti-sigma F factor [Christensenellales bacterium]
MNNQMELKFSAIPENEAFARMVVSAFLVQANPTLSIVSEVRTAVSEAVTNAIVHAYEETSGYVMLRAWIDENDIRLEIEDQGKGIENIKQAMQPVYTSHPEQERTGMGFALMQSFMDHVRVQSSLGNGTIVFMRKRLHENDE